MLALCVAVNVLVRRLLALNRALVGRLHALVGIGRGGGRGGLVLRERSGAQGHGDECGGQGARFGSHRCLLSKDVLGSTTVRCSKRRARRTREFARYTA